MIVTKKNGQILRVNGMVPFKSCSLKTPLVHIFYYLVLKPKPHRFKLNRIKKTEPHQYYLVLVFDFRNPINMVMVRFLV